MTGHGKTNGLRPFLKGDTDDFVVWLWSVPKVSAWFTAGSSVPTTTTATTTAAHALLVRQRRLEPLKPSAWKVGISFRRHSPSV